MSELPGVELRVEIDAVSLDVPALASQPPFSCGRLVGTDERVVLVAGAHRPGTEVRIDRASCLPLNAAVPLSDRLLVVPVAALLASWRRLNLELGDAAVWTGDSQLSWLAGHVARWAGACPVVQLAGASQTSTDLFRVVDWSDPDRAVDALSALAESRPGFAAIELTGRADVVDILLEVVPRWGRLLLAGPAGQPVTLDFYRNIHRKGVRLLAGTLDVIQVFDAQRGDWIRREVPRAGQVLQAAGTGDCCRALLQSNPTAAAVAVAG